MATPSAFAAFATIAFISGRLDGFNEGTFEKVLVCFSLKACKRTENNLVGLLRKLVSDEGFHATKEELRQ